jgi:hypothetical protein
MPWRGRAPFASVAWQTQISHQANHYRLYPSPSNRTLIKLIPRTVQRALINLAIEDAIAGKSLPAKNVFRKPPRSFRDPKPSANEVRIFSFSKLDHPCPK